MDPILTEGYRKERQKMVRDALEEKNPNLFRQLKKAGKLEEFVKEREQEMWEAFSRGEDKIVLHDCQGKNFKHNALEQAKEVEARLRDLWERTREAYLEFS